MSTLSQSEVHICSILEGDRIWSAYAIADLDPEHKHHCLWFANKAAVILMYRGFTPPILFAYGPPESLEDLFPEIPQGEYVFTLQRPSRDIIDPRLLPKFEDEMWRMFVNPKDFTPSQGENVIQLSLKDLHEIELLFADHHDRPDAFAPTQLRDGIYFGIRQGRDLVSVAGTHVLSTRHSVAGIGNVFTRPDQRNRGLGTQVSSALVSSLLNLGIRTMVLNVSTSNLAAIRSYTRIGFQQYCKYQEGLGTLAA